MTRTVFLPGAGGRRAFWQPVSDRLDLGPDALLLGWPGFGDEPPDPRVHTLAGLTDFVLDRVEGPFNLVAQSMGGVVALQVALRAPERVRNLVLCATSGGVDFGDIERDDWRPGYLREMPEATPRWFVDDRTDVTARLPEIGAPALLLWGEDDAIVPPAAGRMLERLLPGARLVVIPEAGHDVAQTHADEVAAHIRAFLSEDTLPILPLEREGATLPAVTRSRLADEHAGVAGAQPMPVLSEAEGRGGPRGVPPQRGAKQRDSHAMRRMGG